MFPAPAAAAYLITGLIGAEEGVRPAFRAKDMGWAIKFG